MLDSYLSALCQYAVRTGLIQPDDVVCAATRCLTRSDWIPLTKLQRPQRCRLRTFCRL